MFGFKRKDRNRKSQPVEPAQRIKREGDDMPVKPMKPMATQNGFGSKPRFGREQDAFIIVDHSAVSAGVLKGSHR